MTAAAAVVVAVAIFVVVVVAAACSRNNGSVRCRKFVADAGTRQATVPAQGQLGSGPVPLPERKRTSGRKNEPSATAEWPNLHLPRLM